ncbi:DUF3618 domain-containing protein [Pseudactinotalea sp. HY158]|uniref:DUF3618 domain-containing protein n=1 Tax=unclassified Pseudactinotalea TaxID=2649176 RepID=UPI00128BDF6E|nr:DUF3618 domain-containing protein [Pseudactinotalea sp. HY158]MPV51302.1 DUF3618 domain-containing protein [Pseudactinotalea sp. HY160]QGH70607.1 DUF3618 domain-containing protein [Pseudactinotalea sp. HY158]
MSEQTEEADKAPKKPARTVAEIEADLAAQRAELTAAVDDLTRSLDPRTQLAEFKEQAATVVANAAGQAKDLGDRVRSKEPGAIRIVGAAAAGLLALGALAVVARRRSRRE